MQKVRGHGLTKGEPSLDLAYRASRYLRPFHAGRLHAGGSHTKTRSSRPKAGSANKTGIALGEPAPTACRHPVSGSLSLPSSGCFSPFPHGTGSLSVTEEYLGLEGGPPMFRQDFTCPALLEAQSFFYPYGAITHFGRPFQSVPVLND